MNRTQMCRAFARAGVLVAALASHRAPSRTPHLFPDEIPSDHGSLMQLAVPNEEENASTTQIQMTVPTASISRTSPPVAGWTITGETAAR